MIIAFGSNKGGTAKTTSAVHFAHYITSVMKRKVLLVDCDPQCDSTALAGFDPIAMEADLSQKTLGHFLLGENIDNCIHTKPKRKYLDVLPAIPAMSDILYENIDIDKNRFITGLNSVSSTYDYIILDLSPDRHKLTIMALSAADIVFVPAKPETRGASGIINFIKYVNKSLKQDYNKEIYLGGIFFTQVQEKVNIHTHIREELVKVFGNTILPQIVRQNIDIATAQQFGQTVYKYNPKSNGAKDYTALSKSILDRCNDWYQGVNHG